jgi:hypothetical protein
MIPALHVKLTKKEAQMSQSDQKIRQQLQILQEGVDDAWFFETQPNIPRMGEYVTIFDKDGTTIIEGWVKEVHWSYIEESHDSSCTVTLRPEKR